MNRLEQWLDEKFGNKDVGIFVILAVLIVMIGVALAVLVTSCATPGILTPATGPGTDYPCGVYGVVCQNHMCCSENQVCGGDDPTCPRDSCCFVGSPLDLGGARKQADAGRP